MSNEREASSLGGAVVQALFTSSLCCDQICQEICQPYGARLDLRLR